MELFNKDGCLTFEAISKIINGDLNEMQRLETSEHLSFCDHCLSQYTNAVCEIPEELLLEPSSALKRNIIFKIKQRTVAVFYNRYVAVTVAASFAILMTFSINFMSLPQNNSDPTIKYQQELAQNKKQQQELDTIEKNKLALELDKQNQLSLAQREKQQQEIEFNEKYQQLHSKTNKAIQDFFSLTFLKGE